MRVSIQRNIQQTQQRVKVQKKQFQRSNSRSPYKSPRKQSKSQTPNFFIKGVHQHLKINRKDFQNSMNVQKKIKNRIIIFTEQIQQEQRSTDTTTKCTQNYSKPLDNLVTKNNSETISNQKIQQHVSVQKQLQQLKRQNQTLRKENQRLLKLVNQFHNKNIEDTQSQKLDLLSNGFQEGRINQESGIFEIDNHPFKHPSEMNPQNCLTKTTTLQQFCTDDNQQPKLNQQPTQTSIISFQSIFNLDFEYQLYQAKLKINQLFILLSCERRKHLFMVEQMKKAKDEEIREMKRNYLKFLDSYKLNIKNMTTKWCQSKRSQTVIKKKPSEDLQYSFQEQDTQC